MSSAVLARARRVLHRANRQSDVWSVKKINPNAMIHLTDQRSVALFGPRNTCAAPSRQP